MLDKIERFWCEFDTGRMGVLGKIDAFKFVNKVLKSVKGEYNYNITDFDSWFEQNDYGRASTLEKDVIVQYLNGKVD